MTSDPVASDLTALLAPALAEAGFDLDSAEVSTAGRRRVVRVLVDSADGVTLDEVATATRVVDETLERSDVLGDRPYTLEVSSPGIDRPLTLPRHWRRNRGRLVAVRLDDEVTLTGRVLRSDDESVTLELARPARSKGAKQATVADGERTLAFSDIARATVEIEFNPPRNADQAGLPADEQGGE